MKKVLARVYKNFNYWVLSASLFVIFSLINYFLLTKSTSWRAFLTQNNPDFVFLTIVFSFANNILISLALTLVVYVVRLKKRLGKGATTNSLVATFLSLVSVGCAVCGGFLLPLVGIAASLTAFPFQGLEIKAFSIVVLLVVIFEMKEAINGKLKRSLAGMFLGLAVLVLVYLIPRLPWDLKQNIFGSQILRNRVTATSQGDRTELFDEINPERGYEIDSSWGDLGPRMIALGVIDLEKFKQVYEQSGQPLTKEQLDILTEGSEEKIKIDRSNSYFLLNFFWAAGLANKSKVLTEGEMIQYGGLDGAGGFASTGGWSLAKSAPMDYYASSVMIPMTPEEEVLAEKVASNIYRPCCNNSTSFPDCNHGMALLAVLQLMASQGATEEKMYNAAKYFSAYWFPSNYYDLALYFKNKEGKNFKDVPGQVILGKDYSSATGWSNVKQWLIDNGIVEEPPSAGGSCGV